MKNKVTKALSSCPRCRAKDLLTFEGDQFCCECSWDSLKMSVDRGDMDNIYDTSSEKSGAGKQEIENLPVDSGIDCIIEPDLADDVGGSAA